MGIFGDIFVWLAAAAVAIGGAFFYGRKTGITGVENKQLKDALEKVKKRKKIEDDVEILDDEGLAKRVSKWVRESNDSK